MRRSFKEAQKADIVILMTDATKAALIQSHSVDDLVNEELSNIFSQVSTPINFDNILNGTLS